MKFLSLGFFFVHRYDVVGEKHVKPSRNKIKFCKIKIKILIQIYFSFILVFDVEFSAVWLTVA